LFHGIYREPLQQTDHNRDEALRMGQSKEPEHRVGSLRVPREQEAALPRPRGGTATALTPSALASMEHHAQGTGALHRTRDIVRNPQGGEQGMGGGEVSCVAAVARAPWRWAMRPNARWAAPTPGQYITLLLMSSP
jgi:hypothetical protein